jgi:hypothetical protein
VTGQPAQVGVQATPNDPEFSRQQWARTINAPAAWDLTEGQGVKLAILDDGTVEHPDLKVVRQDFTGNPTQMNAHGTEVAGLAGATSNNGIGIAGTAGKLDTFFDVKVANNGSFLLSDLIEGMDWAVSQGTQVISISIGGTAPCSAALQAAVDNAWAHNVTVVAAPGNDGLENANKFPTNCNHVIAVGATSSDGTTKTSFSNYGSNVPVATPGDNVWTTVPGGYAGRAGTSMSTPIFAGAVALYKARNPSATPDQVLDRFCATAKPVTGFRCGLIDVAAALGTSTNPTPTPAPTSVTQSCTSNRPKVGVQTAPDSGRLRVVISATGVGDPLIRIQFGINQGALIDVPGLTTGSTGNFTWTLPANTSSAVFYVRRQTPGVAATAPFTVVDSCGPWTTFAGGGTSAGF